MTKYLVAECVHQPPSFLQSRELGTRALERDIADVREPERMYPQKEHVHLMVKASTVQYIYIKLCRMQCSVH